MIAMFRKSSRTFGVGYKMTPPANHELDVRRPLFAVPALDDLPRGANAPREISAHSVRVVR